MSTLLDDAIEALRSLPEDVQASAARAILCHVDTVDGDKPEAWG
jgi:hypothetical protein